MCKLFPLVVSEGGDVEVDQLGGELGELVVETDGVVSADSHRRFFILGGSFPGVGMNNLAVGPEKYPIKRC